MTALTTRPGDPVTLRLDARLVGLPGVAHGGALAGRLATELGRTRVRLAFLRPLPAGDDVHLRVQAGAVVLTHRHATVVRILEPGAEIAVREVGPQPAGPELTAAAGHPVPGCVACGPEHPHGLGLELARSATGGGVVGSWRPPAGWARPDGSLPRETLGAVLDCAGFWAAAVDVGPQQRGTVVTGSLQLELHRPARADEACAVSAWTSGREARGTRVAAALHDRDGQLVGAAEQLLVGAPWGFPLDAVRARVG